MKNVVYQQVWDILMDQKQPHLAIRMNDALKVLDNAIQAENAEECFEAGPDFEDGPDEEGFKGPRPWNGFQDKGENND